MWTFIWWDEREIIYAVYCSVTWAHHDTGYCKVLIAFSIDANVGIYGLKHYKKGLEIIIMYDSLISYSQHIDYLMKIIEYRKNDKVFLKIK